MIRTMMTWQAARRRWRKWYKGILYQVSCDQLGCPQTKADSYQAANAWWSAKKTEIDNQNPRGMSQRDQDPGTTKGLAAYSRSRRSGDWIHQSDQ